MTITLLSVTLFSGVEIKGLVNSGADRMSDAIAATDSTLFAFMPASWQKERLERGSACILKAGEAVIQATNPPAEGQDPPVVAQNSDISEVGEIKRAAFGKPRHIDATSASSRTVKAALSLSPPTATPQQGGSPVNLGNVVQGQDPFGGGQGGETCEACGSPLPPGTQPGAPCPTCGQPSKQQSGQGNDPVRGATGVLGNSLFAQRPLGSKITGPGTAAGGPAFPGGVNVNAMSKVATQSCSQEQTTPLRRAAGLHEASLAQTTPLWAKVAAEGPFQIAKRNKADQPPWSDRQVWDAIPTDLPKVQASRQSYKPTTDMMAKDYGPGATSDKLKKRIHSGAELRGPYYRNILNQWEQYRQVNPGTPASELGQGVWQNIQQQMPYKAPTWVSGPSAKYSQGGGNPLKEGVFMPSDPNFMSEMGGRWGLDAPAHAESAQHMLPPALLAHEQTHAHTDIPKDVQRSEVGVEFPAVLTDMLAATQGYNKATGQRITGRAVSDDMITDKGDYNPKAQWMADMAKKHVRLGTGDIVKELNTPAGLRWTRQFLDTLSLPPKDPAADEHGLVWPEAMRGLEKTNALNPTAVGEGDYSKLKCIPYNSYGGDVLKEIEGRMNSQAKKSPTSGLKTMKIKQTSDGKCEKQATSGMKEQQQDALGVLQAGGRAGAGRAGPMMPVGVPSIPTETLMQKMRRLMQPPQKPKVIQGPDGVWRKAAADGHTSAGGGDMLKAAEGLFKRGSMDSGQNIGSQTSGQMGSAGADIQTSGIQSASLAPQGNPMMTKIYQPKITDLTGAKAPGAENLPDIAGVGGQNSGPASMPNPEAWAPPPIGEGGQFVMGTDAQMDQTGSMMPNPAPRGFSMPTMDSSGVEQVLGTHQPGGDVSYQANAQQDMNNELKKLGAALWIEKRSFKLPAMKAPNVYKPPVNKLDAMGGAKNYKPTGASAVGTQGLTRAPTALMRAGASLQPPSRGTPGYTPPPMPTATAMPPIPSQSAVQQGTPSTMPPAPPKPPVQPTAAQPTAPPKPTPPPMPKPGPYGTTAGSQLGGQPKPATPKMPTGAGSFAHLPRGPQIPLDKPTAAQATAFPTGSQSAVRPGTQSAPQTPSMSSIVAGGRAGKPAQMPPPQLADPTPQAQPLQKPQPPQSARVLSPGGQTEIPDLTVAKQPVPMGKERMFSSTVPQQPPMPTPQPPQRDSNARSQQEQLDDAALAFGQGQEAAEDKAEPEKPQHRFHEQLRHWDELNRGGKDDEYGDPGGLVSRGPLAEGQGDTTDKDDKTVPGGRPITKGEAGRKENDKRDMAEYYRDLSTEGDRLWNQIQNKEEDVVALSPAEGNYAQRRRAFESGEDTDAFNTGRSRQTQRLLDEQTALASSDRARNDADRLAAGLDLNIANPRLPARIG